METKFRLKQNLAVMLFLLIYTGNFIFSLFSDQTSKEGIIALAVFGVLLFVWFYGFRPYRYVVEKRTLTICYRFWKNKEIDLIQCDTICDPVPRMSEMIRRPHAIEMYTNSNKRLAFYPSDRLGFVEAIVKANKRIHCTVKDYTDVHRQLGRKIRKERRKEEKKQASLNAE